MAHLFDFDALMHFFGGVHYTNDTRYKVDLYSFKTNFLTLNPGETTEDGILRARLSLEIDVPPAPPKNIPYNHREFKRVARTIPGHNGYFINLSDIFREHIDKTEIHVLSATCQWNFCWNHPGGYTEERVLSDYMRVTNSWQIMEESESGGEFTVGGMLAALNLSLSFNANVEMKRVEDFERETIEATTRTIKFTKDPCYVWQEVIVVETNKQYPFHEITIPTNHTVTTDTEEIPGDDRFVFCRG